MTLNANFSGANPSRPGVLQGTDRGLDALVGLVILIAELIIGVLTVFALSTFGQAAAATMPSPPDAISGWFALAFFGSIIVVSITTISYLIKIGQGRRSWPSPLWGLILMTVIVVIGYAIMAG